MLLLFRVVVGLDSAGPPKISLFFPSPTTVSLFFSLTVCLLVEYWWFLEAPGPSNVHVWALGLWCETPAASGAPGQRRHTVREKKSEMVAGKGKKREILGLPPFGPHPSGPHFF